MSGFDPLLEPRPEDDREADHECDGDGESDTGICADCKEHSGFCSICGLSECCGAGDGT
jgi:hypothetical protein